MISIIILDKAIEHCLQSFGDPLVKIQQCISTTQTLLFSFHALILNICDIKYSGTALEDIRAFDAVHTESNISPQIVAKLTENSDRWVYQEL